MTVTPIRSQENSHMPSGGTASPPTLGTGNRAPYKDLHYLRGNSRTSPLYLLLVDVLLLLRLRRWHVFDFVQQLRLGCGHTVVGRAADQHAHGFPVIAPETHGTRSEQLFHIWPFRTCNNFY